MIKLTYTEEASPALLETVYQMVTAGGQIKLDEAILKKNIANSQTIATYTTKDRDGKLNIVGIAVVKTPQKSYKRKVFEKAAVAEAQDRFPYEIGYCVTLPGYEGIGICKNLVQDLVGSFYRTNFFATTKNPAMKKIFTNLGFEEFGDSYPDANNTNEYLTLYVLDKY